MQIEVLNEDDSSVILRFHNVLRSRALDKARDWAKKEKISFTSIGIENKLDVTEKKGAKSLKLYYDIELCKSVPMVITKTVQIPLVDRK